jgi:hypothetical protein
MLSLISSTRFTLLIFSFSLIPKNGGALIAIRFVKYHTEEFKEKKH